MKIIIDADACPVEVKEILYRASERLSIQLILVANQMQVIPNSETTSFVVVAAGPDEADRYIESITEAGDLIITADIPLGHSVIKKNAVVIEHHGTLIDQNNIGQKLALRDLMTQLRSEGMQTSGPKPFSLRDKQNFANQLDRFLTKLTKLN